MTTEGEKCIIKVSKGFLFQLLLSVLKRNQLLPSESFIYGKTHCSIKPWKCKSYTYIFFFKIEKKISVFFPPSFLWKHRKENTNNIFFCYCLLDLTNFRYLFSIGKKRNFFLIHSKHISSNGRKKWKSHESTRTYNMITDEAVASLRAYTHR